MAATAATSTRARRRPVKAVERVVHPQNRASFGATALRLATSSQAKAAYVAVGTVGLAALAVAIIGPKKLERDVIRPLRGAVTPPAEKLWDELGPLRDKIANLFEAAGPSKDRLADRLQSWVGHFRAT